MTRGALTDWAYLTARGLLTPIGHRWDHVREVGKVARCIAHAFNEDGEILVAAAYLHDVGYSSVLNTSGFHPLDGARFLRTSGHIHLANLVAHHSGARHEARLRGLVDYELEFPFAACDLDRALTYCDLTTGPKGSRVTLQQRVDEIIDRYGDNHIVARAIVGAVPEFEEAVRSTEHLMAKAGIELTGSLALPR